MRAVHAHKHAHAHTYIPIKGRERKQRLSLVGSISEKRDRYIEINLGRQDGSHGPGGPVLFGAGPELRWAAARRRPGRPGEEARK